ncbi:hypothetical protein FRB95_001279 [Tulasnella sp. JGI-2019a]|nr:hypothetical protein FRB95_001279 [Tulasnella sp. JGI-2019a]
MQYDPSSSSSMPPSARPVPQLRLQTDTSFPSSYDPNVEHDLSALGYSLQPSSPLYLDPSSPVAKTFQASKIHPKDNEFRKVLGILLNKLHNRKRPPPIYDEFRNPTERRDGSKVGVALDAIRGAVRLGKKAPRSVGQSSMFDDPDSDEDIKDEDSYSTDATVESLTQLRDVLILAERLGWNIMSGPSVTAQDEPPSPRTKVKRRRQGILRSESKDKRRARETDTLEECIDLLAEIISEDCRFRVKTIRLVRPPNALQSICLDFAQCLLTNQKHNPSNLMKIGIAVIPAFVSFEKDLHARILRFFEESVLREMLDGLMAARSSTRSSDGISSSLTSLATQPLLQRATDTDLPVLRIDEPKEEEKDDKAGWVPWTLPGRPSRSIASTSAPGQDLHIYQLSAPIGPLLCAVLENITRASARMDTNYRFHQLVELIINAKPDAYLDLLEIIAYHTKEVRYTALSILSSFWPSAVGHAFVGKALPIVSYERDAALRSGRGSRDDCAYSHQFLLWIFPAVASGSQGARRPSKTASAGSAHQRICDACLQWLEGFGLLCTGCMSAVHTQCYDDPQGQYFIPYPLVDDHSKQRVAVPKFSRLLPHRRVPALEGTIILGHRLHRANVFTLIPCIVCTQPIWGCAAQALECQECQHFIHPACSSSLRPCGRYKLSSALFTVEWTTLRMTFLEHYRDIIFPEAALAERSQEEVSVCYGILSIQLEIFRNGIESSTIIITGKAPSPRRGTNVGADDEWEIQTIVDTYRTCLLSGQLLRSGTLQEYRQMSTPVSTQLPGLVDESILFEWPLLSYMAALVKSPQRATGGSQTNGASDFLTVNLNEESGAAGEELGHPFEMTSLSHMRDVLALEFKMIHDPSAKHLLSHLHQAGFFRQLNQRADLFPASDPSEVICIFPLPQIIDYSTSVETLVSAIDVCLQDLDITVNEVGFLWLTKRCWPDGMASDYALHRLAGLVVSWIVSEDDRLLRTAKDFVTRGVPVPGVRSSNDMSPWPISSSARSNATTSSTTGGSDYRACRNELLQRYCYGWLLALHNQDSELFAKAIYNAAVELAEDEGEEGLMDSLIVAADDAADTTKRMTSGDRTLRNIQKVYQHGVMFSAFGSVITAWLDVAAQTSSDETVTAFPSLRRLNDRPTSAVLRASVIDSLKPYNFGGTLDTECWRIVLDSAADGLQGILRATRWLRILAQSSVEVPQTALLQLAARTQHPDVPFHIHVIIAEAMFCTAWIGPLDRHDLIAILSQLNVQHAAYILTNSADVGHKKAIIAFVQLTLAASLLFYGFDRNHVALLGFVEEKYVNGLVLPRTRARANTTRILGVDNDLVQTAARYITEGNPEIATIAAKFICILFGQPSLMAPEAVSRFLTSSGQSVFESIWAIYELQDRTLELHRSRLLIQLLTTSPESFGDILARTFQPQSNWNQRFQAVHRLFTMIVEFNDPKVLVEGSKFAVLPIFAYFFKSMWEDKSEEVRLSVRTLARTLLPAHLTTISSCWDETFARSDVSNRLEMVLFLLQLSPHFPPWEVLSWHSILEAMLQDDAIRLENRKNPEEETDAAKLRLALTSLCLEMLGNGISTDLYTLMKIKQSLALALGFPEAELVQNADGNCSVRLGRNKGIAPESYVCLSSMVRALDAPTLVTLPSTTMGLAVVPEPSTQCFTGAVFIDLALSVISNIEFRNFQYLHARSTLDALIVIIYKFDFYHPSIVELQEQLTNTVDFVTHIVQFDMSYDLRSAAFTAAQGFLKRWPNLVIRILNHQIPTVAALLKDLDMAPDNLLVAQGTAFLEAAFEQFQTNGLFVLLFKYPLQNGFFEVMKHVLSRQKGSSRDGQAMTLKEMILSDTMSKMTDRIDQNFTQILTNLQLYAEMVHHQGYSQQLMQDIVMATHALTRMAVDPSPMPFDPNPWLELCMLIVRHNRAKNRELVASIEMLLKASLSRTEIRQSCLKEFVLLTAPTAQHSHKDIAHHPALMLFEILTDGIRGKIRTTPGSVSAMLACIVDILKTREESLPLNTTLLIGPEAANALSTTISLDGMYQESSFNAMLNAAGLVHEAMKRDSTFLQQHFVAANERLYKSPPPVRAWNALALAALDDTGPASATGLLHNLTSFALSLATSLRPLTAMSIHAPPEEYSFNLNQAFTAIKLWMLMCRKIHDPVAHSIAQDADELTALGRRDGNSGEESEESRTERRVWNELWPPFEGILIPSMSGNGAEDSTSLNLAIWSAFAEIVLFVHQIRSPVALESSVSHMTMLKDLMKRSRSDTTNNKLSRALKCILQPPTEIQQETIILQTRAELLGIEKLNYALDSRWIVASGLDRRNERRRDNRTAP